MALGSATVARRLTDIQPDDVLLEAIMPGDILGHEDVPGAEYLIDTSGKRWLVVYTDGSATGTKSVFTSRAGWGVWVAPGFTSNLVS